MVTDPSALVVDFSPYPNVHPYPKGPFTTPTDPIGPVPSARIAL
jgi:hypothetical protein